MELSVWQLGILIIFSFFTILDSLSLNLGCQFPVIVGAFVGMVIGDLRLGLMIGSTLQLMVLGVGTYGGASVPDFTTGAIVGTVYAYLTGGDVEFALALAVPVGLLMVQLDVLARFSNTFFLHRVDRSIERMDLKGIRRNILLGALPWGLSRAIPVSIMLIFGRGVINAIVNQLPDWLMGGLKVSGGLLPVVGIAVLLRYLPTKKFFPYLIIGFFCAAYLKVPMLGVACVGSAIALIAYNNQIQNKPVFVNAVSSEGEDDYEE
ncbi:PTS mannose/fructose/sorbose/N-acetylgalactosamine transporter subunit IIC [Enterococcus mediterraneensis]|uniref:PTS mannose/fructose/sorbose/N-acetylgalactosamine transporter subunit IIC n=1 Tax=Enterococcus mediterraneensis TaxID=2364791 RepID=UPI000F06B2A0|nr:PTS sugar transporter subunit IIC [Enterococcus mediterraneensis]